MWGRLVAGWVVMVIKVDIQIVGLTRYYYSLSMSRPKEGKAF